MTIENSNGCEESQKSVEMVLRSSIDKDLIIKFIGAQQSQFNWFEGIGNDLLMNCFIENKIIPTWQNVNNAIQVNKLTLTSIIKYIELNAELLGSMPLDKVVMNDLIGRILNFEYNNLDSLKAISNSFIGYKAIYAYVTRLENKVALMSVDRIKYDDNDFFQSYKYPSCFIEFIKLDRSLCGKLSTSQKSYFVSAVNSALESNDLDLETKIYLLENFEGFIPTSEIARDTVFKILLDYPVYLKNSILINMCFKMEGIEINDKERIIINCINILNEQDIIVLLNGLDDIYRDMLIQKCENVEICNVNAVLVDLLIAKKVFNYKKYKKNYKSIKIV